MASSFKAIFQLLVIILQIWSPLVSCGSPELFQPEYLNVPVSDFASSLKSTIEKVQNVTSVVHKFKSFFNDFRLASAISACLDLLDLSAEELDWILSSSQKFNGFHYGTGEQHSDYRTWLGGVLANQETCLEGFDGKDGEVQRLLKRRLNEITSSVTDILGMVHPSTDSKAKGGRTGGYEGGRKLLGRDEFPSWLKHKGKKLLHVNRDSADVVVAADGSGNFTSISAAIDIAPELCADHFIIYIKRGVYKEYVEINKRKLNVVLIGDGIDATVISGNRSKSDGWSTFDSGTVCVEAPGFIARDITFENTAGPIKGQAVAFRSDSDLSALYRCAFRGYQDTLYIHTMRQFYKECVITGTVDFIFGHGSAVFQGCEILSRKCPPGQSNVITANGRFNSSEDTGFSIQFSHISAEPDVLASSSAIATYLGRPWKLFSRTVIMQSNISSAIHPRGWLEYNKSFALDTLYFGEYMNYGPGASLEKRIKWPGFHVINDPAEANQFTVGRLIVGSSWLPSTGVKYTVGLND